MRKRNVNKITNKILSIKDSTRVCSNSTWYAFENRTLYTSTPIKLIYHNRLLYRSLYNKIPHIYSGLKPHNILVINDGLDIISCCK